jgi:predicted ATP-grasp superfamily ATP-dependent carboligase
MMTASLSEARRDPPVVVLRLGNHRYPYVCAAIARSLGRIGIDVHLVHVGPPRADSRSRWLRSSHRLSALAGRLEELLSVATSLDPDRARPILMSVDDPAAFFVQEHGDVLATAYRFPRQPPGVVERLSNKAKLHGLCVDLGIPTPSVVIPGSAREIREMAGSLSYPQAIKIADGRLRRTASVGIVAGPEELVARTAEMQADPAAPNLILQEYVPGGARDVWMFNGYFDDRSRMRFGITGRKLRQYPPDGGVTAFGVTAPNARVQELIGRLAGECGYRGPIDVGFRYDRRDDQYKLLDVNPRIGATFRLFVDSHGTDVARMTYLDLAGAPHRRGSPLYGRTWMVENYDLRTSLRVNDRLRGLRGWLRAVGSVDEAAWFATDDLRPFAAMVGQSCQDLAAMTGLGRDGWRGSGGPEPPKPRLET